MKIALLGFGRMGQLIERIAIDQGHKITARFNRERLENIDAEELIDTDVCIDFSHFECTLNNLRKCIKIKKPLIIGTTGWETHLDELKMLMTESSIGCLYAPNFSIGMALYMHLVAEAAKVVGKFDDYHVAGVEYHHHEKVDAPSGTAKALSDIFPAKVVFSSVRCGSMPGKHEIIFDSPVDTITLKHEARTRDGFANGAIRAAEWIQGRRGLYTMNDLITSLHNSGN